MRAGVMKTRLAFYRQVQTKDANGSTVVTYAGSAYYTGSFQRVRQSGNEAINIDRIEEDVVEVYRGRIVKTTLLKPAMSDKVLNAAGQEFNIREIDDSEAYYGNVILKVTRNT